MRNCKTVWARFFHIPVLVTDDSVNLLLQFIFFTRVCTLLCVCGVFIQVVNPRQAGPSLAVQLCVRTYSSVFGEGITGDERPTFTQNRMKGTTRRERRSPFTNSRQVLRLSLLLFCSPAPFSERFHPKCLTVPCVLAFLALVAPLGMQHQPLLTSATLAAAVPCSAS